MTKLLAETKGTFQLYDLASGELLSAHRPSVITSSLFFQDRIGRNQILVLGEVKADATDEDFEETWTEVEGDRQLAIDSFLAEFAIAAAEPAEAEGTAPRRRGRRQPAA